MGSCTSVDANKSLPTLLLAGAISCLRIRVLLAGAISCLRIRVLLHAQEVALFLVLGHGTDEEANQSCCDSHTRACSCGPPLEYPGVSFVVSWKHQLDTLGRELKQWQAVGGVVLGQERCQLVHLWVP